MKHLIQETKDLFQRPRLLIQYVVLNFFLISVGLAAVVYTKKELALEHSKTQSEQIINVGQQLRGVDLPPSVERNAEQTLSGVNQSENPKTGGSSSK